MHAILLHHPLSYNKKRFWLYDFLKKKEIVTESIQKYRSHTVHKCAQCSIPITEYLL